VRIIGICPTYRRPRLIPSVIEMWRRQDYPAAERHLIILDDGGSFDEQSGPGWSLFTLPERFGTVGAKFAAIAELALTAGADALTLFEDDDVYFPWHVSAAAATLERFDVAEPSRVLTDYGGTVSEVDAVGRHHGAWSFRAAAYRSAGGYPVEANEAFDLMLRERFNAAGLTRGDPVDVAPISYLYRWFSTGYDNASAAGSDLFAAMAASHVAERVPGPVLPGLDPGAAAYYERFGGGVIPACVSLNYVDSI
jgi:glycosyltransferase involved in cell wall biosynthesis